MKTIDIVYTGRKAKVGNLCVDDRQKMCVFVGYCEHHGKVVMTIEEARQFAKRYNAEKEKLSTKILLKMLQNRQLD